MKRGDAVVLRAGSALWYDRTADELAELEAQDAREGRFTDAAGEPILHSPVGTLYLEADAVAVVTRLKGVVWRGWRRRPSGLAAALATVEGVPRYVMFSRSSVREPDT